MKLTDLEAISWIPETGQIIPDCLKMVASSDAEIYLSPFSYQNPTKSERGLEGKGREGKGREGKGREGKGREGKGREGKGRGYC